MALKPQAAKSAARAVFAQTEETPGGDQPTGGFGNPMTLLLLLVAAGFLWWNMRRRRQFEDRLREQRRADAAAQAEQSAMNVAHIMRAAPSRAEAAAAATEGLASAARMSGATAAPGSGESAQAPTGGQVAELDRARAAAEADRVAAEQAEQAAREAELAESGGRDIVRPADVVAAQARADTAEATGSAASVAELDAAAAAMEGAQVARDDAAVVAEAASNEAGAFRQGVVAGATAAPDTDQDATDALRAGLRDLEREREIPFGAVAGDETTECPEGYPIKGNAQSMIYHEPGQTSYPPTVAEFCFASSEAAEAAGYRRSRARGQRPHD